MSESKKEWKVVDGYYPGFLNIVGASYTVSIVTSATDLTLEDYVNRTNDAHLMAAAPDLLEALEGVLRISDLWLPHEIEEQHGEEMYVLHMARNKMIAAVEKARGQQ